MEEQVADVDQMLLFVRILECLIKYYRTLIKNSRQYIYSSNGLINDKITQSQM